MVNLLSQNKTLVHCPRPRYDLEKALKEAKVKESFEIRLRECMDNIQAALKRNSGPTEYQSEYEKAKRGRSYTVRPAHESLAPGVVLKPITPEFMPPTNKPFRQDSFSNAPRQDSFPSGPRQDSFSNAPRQEFSNGGRQEFSSGGRQDSFMSPPRQESPINGRRQDSFMSPPRQESFSNGGPVQYNNGGRGPPSPRQDYQPYQISSYEQASNITYHAETAATSPYDTYNQSYDDSAYAEPETSVEDEMPPPPPPPSDWDNETATTGSFPQEFDDSAYATDIPVAPPPPNF